MKPVIIITIALVLFISLIIGLIILIDSNNENIAIENEKVETQKFVTWCETCNNHHLTQISQEKILDSKALNYSVSFLFV